MRTFKIILAGLLLAVAIPALAAKSVDMTKAAKPTGEVRISNVSGSITVVGWNKPSVQVTGRIGDDVDHLQFDSDSNGVDIRVVLPRRSYSSHDSDARLVIHLPTGSSVYVDTVSADIKASDVSGSQQLGSVSGTVRLHSKSNDITAKSVSGDVIVKGSAKNAHIDAHSISGDVDVSDVNGDLQAASVSGEITVRNSVLSRAKFSSTSGDISFSGALQKEGKYFFNNTSGDIKLVFSSAPDARFDINTFSGDIRNDFGPRPQRNSEYAPGEQLHFVSGKGSAQISINTMSGDVKLEK